MFARLIPGVRAFLAASITLILMASALGSTSAPPAGPNSPPPPPDPLFAGTCLPTCDPDDARFFGTAGGGFGTLDDVKAVLFIGVAEGTTTFSVGFFDGDVGGFWDEQTLAGDAAFRYRLFRDPLKNGTTSMPFDDLPSGGMPDDSWFDKTYSTDSSAQAPSGNYFYRMEAAWEVDPVDTAFNDFKLRTSGQISVAAGQNFGFAAGPQRIFPPDVDPFVGSGDPNPGDTNDPDANSYDGQFVFFFYVPSELSSITFWDGDADRNLDTDDPNTPNTDPDGGGPAQAEGANSGAPADSPSPYGACCNVPPSISYDVLDPAGNLYTNTNPSGQQEWERFVVGDSSSNPDITITYLLGPGLWRFRTLAMDAHNLNILRSTYEIFSNDDIPLPVNPAPSLEPDNEKTTADNVVVTYAHTVTNNGLATDDFGLEAGSDHGWATAIYHDLDGDGVLDPGEPSITKTGSLGPGATMHIIVTVTVPDLAGNADDFTTVVASSTTEWALQDDAKDTTHVRINEQPTADPGGPYTAPEGTAIAFDASLSTDPDDDPLTYRWDFDGDGTWDTAWSSDPTTSYTWGDDWTGTVKLEVSDGELTDTASVPVKVTNVSPRIESTTIPSGDEAESLLFKAQVTDPGSDDLVVSWSGACTGWSAPTTYPNDPANFPDPDPSPDVHPRDVTDPQTVVCGDDGTFDWNLLVEDDDGGSSQTADTTFSVANLAPSLTIPPPSFVTVDEGVAWTLTATAEDAGSDDLTFTWTWELGPTEGTTYFNDGVGPDPDPSPGPTYPFTASDSSTHTYGDDGTYAVTLRVEDDDRGFVEVTTTFSTANLPPFLTVSPPSSTTVDEGTLVTLTATAKDPGSDDLTFTWTWTHGPTETTTYFNDGAAPDPDRSPGGTFPFAATDTSSRTYGDDCACTVQLRVEDDDGGFLTFETSVTVLNVDPSVLAGDAGGDEAATIDFAATFSDPGFDFGAGDSREDFTASVDWGDGASESVTVSEVPGGPGVPTTGSLAATHVYGDNGAFTVTAEVCDDDGGCGTASATITVLNVAPAPSIDEVTQDQDRHLLAGRFYPLDPITFNGSAVDVGSDDLTLSWSWGDGSPDTVGPTHFNDGVGPDPSPSPGGTYPFAAKDTVQHVYDLPGDYLVTLTATDDDRGAAQVQLQIHVTSPADLKNESIQQIRALKQQALDRGDWKFVRNLDDAERFVWRSLGYADPLRPATIAAEPGTDVTIRGNQGDRIDLVLGPSWTPRLAAYTAIQVTWANDVVSTVDLPDGWPSKRLQLDDTVWVDAWEQDLGIESKRDKKTGQVILKVHAHDASLGFSLSLDSDFVADLAFTYEILPYWKDGAHLDPKLGANVFVCEAAAVDRLVKLVVSEDDDDEDDDDDGGDDGGDDDGERDGERRDAGTLGGDDDDDDEDDDEDDAEVCRCGDEDDDDDDEDEDDEDGGDDDDFSIRTVHCRLTPKLWSDEDRAELDAECDAIANLLVKADEILARIALEEAMETPVKDPGNQGRFDREIGRSERSLAEAYEQWNLLEYGDAICDFLRAWQHAQRAIEIARK